jgi:RNA polymerase sigma factor (sigma-70 family)
MEPTDEELVLACRQGDAAAWEMLVNRYQRLVYSIPRRAGLGEDMAADVFQQVFATLVERLDQIEQPERIGAWLVTTARRESWRVGRRERLSRPSLDDESETTELVDGSDLPDEVALRLEAQHTIRVAVEALDERCRVLIQMLFYRPDPPPYADIAARLGASEGSIGPTRARCLQKLRQLLQMSAS